MDGLHSGFQTIINTAYYQAQGNNDWLILTVDPMGMTAESFATISQGDGLLITFNDGTPPTGQNYYTSDEISSESSSGEYSHSINLGSADPPILPNKTYDLSVVAYCNNTYNNDQYIFTPEGSNTPQAESEIHSITWTSEEEGGGFSTSSMVNNSSLNNITVDNIENILDNPNVDINLLIEDIIGKE